MNWNEWRSRITVGSPVVLGGESHIIDAITEWVTLRATDGTTRRMPLRNLTKMLADGEVRRRLAEMVTGWQTDLVEQMPREGSSVFTAGESERLVRAFLRYRVHDPGSTSMYTDFAAWVRREHGAEAPTEHDFVRALRIVFREDPPPRAGAIRHPSTSQTRKADTPHRMTLRPGQSLSINVTVSIVDRADGKE